MACSTACEPEAGLASAGAILQRWGQVPRRKGKGVLVWGARPEAFARAEPVLAALLRRNPRLNVFRLCPSAPTRASLARSGAAGAWASPAPFGPVLRRTLLRTRAQLLLLAEAPDAAAARLVECAAGEGVGVAALLAASASEGAGAWPPGVSLWLDAGDPAGAAAELERLGAGRRGSGGRSERAWERPLAGLSSSRALRWKYRSIASVEALGEALGRPDAILCLGNGPSCEDPRLRELSFDALFRVNHAWQARGFLARPQMVFTGRRASIAAVRAPVIFGFQTRQEERKLLFKCLPLPRRIRFATVERLGVMDFGGFGSFVPTNGAVMLAAAVALQPKRLIVAGIDLFQHPTGSYPGDSETPNAYTVLHDRETELSFILDRLERFRGELVLIGDVLAEHWRRARVGRGGPPPH